MQLLKKKAPDGLSSGALLYLAMIGHADVLLTMQWCFG
jgi:hypothetical protein